jgi:hypothetical protein
MFRMTLRRLFLPVLLVLCASPLSAGSAFAPRKGKTLLIIGQDINAIKGYLGAGNPPPAGFSAYTSVEGEGLTEMANNGGGIQNTWELGDNFPDTVLQLAFYMVDSASKVAAGDVDANLDDIAKFIRGYDRPVYLRIGYEFDLPENGYKPADYIAAYRHVVDRFRKDGVTNAAYVWHSYAGPETRPVEDWYPGDSYVDWFAVSWFDQPKGPAEAFAALARKHGKPLMIAEAAPWRMTTTKASTWDAWFEPLFQFIRRNDVRALCYINCDWDTLPLFNDKGWGDTRLQSNPDVLKRWKAEMKSDRFLKSSSTLLPSLGYRRRPER